MPTHCATDGFAAQNGPDDNAIRTVGQAETGHIVTQNASAAAARTDLSGNITTAIAPPRAPPYKAGSSPEPYADADRTTPPGTACQADSGLPIAKLCKTEFF